jgi:carboxyl-terminal processing protease
MPALLRGGLVVLCLGLLGFTQTCPGKEPVPPAQRSAAQLWALTEIILEQHVAPPTRQELLLGSLLGLFQASKSASPADLARTVSGVTTQNEFSDLLSSCWPDKEKGLSAKEVQRALLQGMIARVPGGVRWVPAEQLKVEKQIQANRYVGIGIQLRLHAAEAYPQIITPFRRGPAHQAGAKPGDLMVEIDGVDTHKVNLSKVVDMLRGQAGTKVTVVVRQPGSKETRTLKMTRGEVPFASLAGFRRARQRDWTYRIGDSRVAYVAVRAIRASTLHEMRQLEHDLRREEARALILDLRFCQGGLISHSALVADALLDGGTLWTVQERGGRSKEIKADRDCLFRGWPMAVLIHPRTAPSAGWLAAALQDNERAVVIGQDLRGHVFVRELISLPGDAGAVELPTAYLERKRARTGFNLDLLKSSPVLIVIPDQRVPLSDKQSKSLVQWLNWKEHTELASPAADEPPEDPQRTRALALLEKKLARVRDIERIP